MKPLKNGAKVRLVQPVIEGVVLGTETNGDDFGYRVAYQGADGEAHQRFFAVDQVEEVPAEEGAK